jgi:hypothetical protein
MKMKLKNAERCYLLIGYFILFLFESSGSLRTH